jgi:nitroimidazol reductase NimA-like FMN-containing flavoprotein (pyridoxamine 5'-phosphate oxidase superfamily)
VKRKPRTSVGAERRPAHDSPEPGSYLVTMSELDPAVCWRLVTKARFGRVGFIRDGEPWILPVNSTVIDETVVFRTARGSMLHLLTPGSTVTFEADGADRVAESGWSVLVRGRISELVDEAAAAAAESGLTPWGPGVRDRWMRIEPFEVTGRIIARGFRPESDHAVSSIPPD